VQVPNQPDAYEFSIRTPVTPPRWKDFDVELEAAWEAVVTQLAKGGWGARLASGSVSMCRPPSARGLMFWSVTVSRRMLALGMSEAKDQH
jgi:hypothetical protein